MSAKKKATTTKKHRRARPAPRRATPKPAPASSAAPVTGTAVRVVCGKACGFQKPLTVPEGADAAAFARHEIGDHCPKCRTVTPFVVRPNA